mgnify:CR=1 FL=1
MQQKIGLEKLEFNHLVCKRGTLSSCVRDAYAIAGTVAATPLIPLLPIVPRPSDRLTELLHRHKKL